MLATAIAERASLRLVTVPLPRSVQGVMLRCPTGRAVNVLVSDRLDSLGRVLVVEYAIHQARQGVSADLITPADLSLDGG